MNIVEPRLRLLTPLIDPLMSRWVRKLFIQYLLDYMEALQRIPERRRIYNHMTSISRAIGACILRGYLQRHVNWLNDQNYPSGPIWGPLYESCRRLIPTQYVDEEAEIVSDFDFEDENEHLIVSWGGQDGMRPWIEDITFNGRFHAWPLGAFPPVDDIEKAITLLERETGFGGLHTTPTDITLPESHFMAITSAIRALDDIRVLTMTLDVWPRILNTWRLVCYDLRNGQQYIEDDFVDRQWLTRTRAQLIEDINALIEASRPVIVRRNVSGSESDDESDDDTPAIRPPVIHQAIDGRRRTVRSRRRVARLLFRLI